MMTGFGFGGIWMMGIWILFWVFVMAGLVWLVLALGRSRRGFDDGGGSALGILEERLARGEIDAEEFRTRRATIAGTSR